MNTKGFVHAWRSILKIDIIKPTLAVGVVVYQTTGYEVVWKIMGQIKF